MNILTITPVYDQRRASGVTTVVKNLTEGLVTRGHECHVLTINRETKENTHETINNIAVHRVGSPSSKYLYGLSREFYQYLNNDPFNLASQADIIHIHMYHNLLSLEAAFLVQKLGKPLVFTPHYMGMGTSRLNTFLHRIYRSFGRRTYHAADKVICVSEYESKMIRKHFSVPDNNILIIPPGVIIKNKYPIKKPASNKTDVSLLYIGRLIKHKGVHYILRAMKHLIASYRINHTLEIIGQGPYKSQLMKMACLLGLEGNISWIDFLAPDQLQKKYKQVDIVLLLSRAECYGLSVAEALAFGTPCIVPKTEGLDEFIQEKGCFGTNYPPVPEDVAYIIDYVHRNEITIGPFHPYKIRAWDKVVDEYEELYSDIQTE